MCIWSPTGGIDNLTFTENRSYKLVYDNVFGNTILDSDTQFMVNMIDNDRQHTQNDTADTYIFNR